jgi:hypothetical protein
MDVYIEKSPPPPSMSCGEIYEKMDEEKRKRCKRKGKLKFK